MMQEWRLDYWDRKAYRLDSGQYVFFRNFNIDDFETEEELLAWLEKEWKTC